MVEQQLHPSYDVEGSTRRGPGDQGGINPIQIGLGSQIGSIDQLYTQGNLEATGGQVAAPLGRAVIRAALGQAQ